VLRRYSKASKANAHNACLNAGKLSPHITLIYTVHNGTYLHAPFIAATRSLAHLIVEGMDNATRISFWSSGMIF
jgi:hypothetical protein